MDLRNQWQVRDVGKQAWGEGSVQWHQPAIVWGQLYPGEVDCDPKESKRTTGLFDLGITWCLVPQLTRLDKQPPNFIPIFQDFSWLHTQITHTTETVRLRLRYPTTPIEHEPQYTPQVSGRTPLVIWFTWKTNYKCLSKLIFLSGNETNIWHCHYHLIASSS